jgi:type I restriction enzyme S subunit
MVNDNLPNGWTQTTFGDIVIRMSNGIAERQSKDIQGFPVTRIETISQGVINLERVGYLQNLSPETVEKYQLQEGDILFSHINSDTHLGKTAIFELNSLKLLHGMNLLRLQVDKSIVMPRFFYYLCNHYRSSGYFIAIAQHAVNQSSINQKKLSQVPFPLPPLPEQERIVAKIEELFTQLDAGMAALKRVQAGLKRYKASVLKAACEGRLLENRGTENNDGLPNGWQWVTVGEIGEISGGITVNSKRGILPKKMPYLRVANVYANELRLDEISEIGVRENEIQRALLQDGDLLVVEGNGSADQIGRVAIWNGNVSPCLHQNHIIKVRFEPKEVAEYILYWLLSDGGREQINRVASSTSGLYTLSLSKVANLKIPLPPLAEQRRIVAEVERRLSVAQEVESVVAASMLRASRLRQSVLKSAFEGRLD